VALARQDGVDRCWRFHKRLHILQHLGQLARVVTHRWVYDVIRSSSVIQKYRFRQCLARVEDAVLLSRFCVCSISLILNFLTKASWGSIVNVHWRKILRIHAIAVECLACFVHFLRAFEHCNSICQVHNLCLLVRSFVVVKRRVWLMPKFASIRSDVEALLRVKFTVVGLKVSCMTEGVVLASSCNCYEPIIHIRLRPSSTLQFVQSLAFCKGLLSVLKWSTDCVFFSFANCGTPVNFDILLLYLLIDAIFVAQVIRFTSIVYPWSSSSAECSSCHRHCERIYRLIV